MYSEEQLIAAYKLGYDDCNIGLLPYKSNPINEWIKYILANITPLNVNRSTLLDDIADNWANGDLDIFEYLEEGFDEKEAESKNNNPNT